jgi:hypothetical protein
VITTAGEFERRNPPMPAAAMRRRKPVDLEHLPAHALSAHGDTAGAMWVYDAAAELAEHRETTRQLATKLEKLQEDVLRALRAEGDDPVAAAEFVRQAADAFAARVAELEPIEQRAREMVEPPLTDDPRENAALWILNGPSGPKEAVR